MVNAIFRMAYYLVAILDFEVFEGGWGVGGGWGGGGGGGELFTMNLIIFQK